MSDSSRHYGAFFALIALIALVILAWRSPSPSAADTALPPLHLPIVIVNRTLMILPIYDADSGSGSSSSYHAARPGAFLLRGDNLSGTVYLDLVYIEQPTLAPCAG